LKTIVNKGNFIKYYENKNRIMNAYIAEFLGTSLLIVLGNGVVANVVLKGTKGHASGWIVITLGWAMAVFIAVYCTSKISGAHLNPAVTVALATGGKFDWALVPGYVFCQIIGGTLGASLVWLHYRDHFDITENEGDVLACFSTGPAIKDKFQNLFSEIFATFIFVISILYISGPTTSLGSLDALPVAFLVLAIGLSLGGNTGYAINPARDLGPRIAHAILPMKYKGSSDWSYAWIPIAGPIIGGILAALVFNLLNL
jgi:glycerol uptake facilitator protein